MSLPEAQCHECGVPVSAETGFRLTGALGDDTEDHVWCLDHGPKRSDSGYTLADLESLKSGLAHRARDAPLWSPDQS